MKCDGMLLACLEIGRLEVVGILLSSRKKARFLQREDAALLSDYLASRSGKKRISLPTTTQVNNLNDKLETNRATINKSYIVNFIHPPASTFSCTCNPRLPTTHPLLHLSAPLCTCIPPTIFLNSLPRYTHHPLPTHLHNPVHVSMCTTPPTLSFSPAYHPHIYTSTSHETRPNTSTPSTTRAQSLATRRALLTASTRPGAMI